jgi:hypothetical protein
VISPKHSIFSPSSMPRYALCPGSWKMTKGLKSKSNEYAEEGTLLHERVVSKNIEGLGNEQIIALEKCWELVETLTATGDWNLIIEQKVNVYSSIFEIMTYGTLDFGLISKDRKKGILVDWKFGRGKVRTAFENLQLKIYALGMHQKYGLEEVEGYIFQPRVYPNKSQATYTDFEGIQKEVEIIIKNCKSDKMVLNPGEEQCKNCLASSFCPACLNAYEGVLQLNPVNIPTSTKKAYNIALKQKIKEIPDEPLKDYYEDCRIVESLTKEIKSEWENRVQEKNELLGYGLKNNAPISTLNNISAVYQQYSNLITQDEFFRTLKVNKIELENLVIDRQKVEKRIRGKKITLTELKKQYKKDIKEFCVFSPKKQSVIKL